MAGTGTALAFAVSFLACSSDDGGGAGGEEIDGVGLTDPAADASSGPEPAAAQPDEVFPYVADLLARYDELVEQIVADPAAVDGPGDLDQEFLDLFVPGSEFAEASLDGWRQMAADGVRLEPASPDHPLNSTYLDSGVQRLTDDEVRFAHCTVQRYVRHRDGDEIDRADEPILLPGTGTAVRVDGRWLLGELTTPPGLTGCTHGSEGP
jgi:hypothetical protein